MKTLIFCIVLLTSTTCCIGPSEPPLTYNQYVQKDADEEMWAGSLLIFAGIMGFLWYIGHDKRR